eukprot:CAMPEP_0183525828 /NCGR_PEP_ID=MMETSP0371-20130417/20920_1 /TAXON_ID=268820 /ORGANISM="Peridinium aciculiferum, Strain PAER-2" /LENGTH=40 /DNA_ID= /DNA_START= /DNA_END= /DNA_ORIENTATION=
MLLCSSSLAGLSVLLNAGRCAARHKLLSDEDAQEAQQIRC